MNKAIISAGDVSINIPDLKLKENRVYYHYTSGDSINTAINFYSFGGINYTSSDYVPINYSGTGFDPENMFTNGTGKFTVQKAGLYVIKLGVGIGNGETTSRNVKGFFILNGSLDSGTSDGADGYFEKRLEGGTHNAKQFYTIQRELSVGDVFYWSVKPQGSSSSDATFTTITTIHRLDIVQETA